MKIINSIKVPGKQQYEMHSFTIEVDTEVDVLDPTKLLVEGERKRIAQYLAAKHKALWMAVNGFWGMQDAKAHIALIQESFLNDKLKSYVTANGL